MVYRVRDGQVEELLLLLLEEQLGLCLLLQLSLRLLFSLALLFALLAFAFALSFALAFSLLAQFALSLLLRLALRLLLAGRGGLHDRVRLLLHLRFGHLLHDCMHDLLLQSHGELVLGGFIQLRHAGEGLPRQHGDQQGLQRLHCGELLQGLLGASSATETAHPRSLLHQHRAHLVLHQQGQQCRSRRVRVRDRQRLQGSFGGSGGDDLRRRRG